MNCSSATGHEGRKGFALNQRVLFHHFKSELSFIKQGYFPCLIFQTGVFTEKQKLSGAAL